MGEPCMKRKCSILCAALAVSLLAACTKAVPPVPQANEAASSAAESVSAPEQPSESDAPLSEAVGELGIDIVKVDRANIKVSDQPDPAHGFLSREEFSAGRIADSYEVI